MIKVGKYYKPSFMNFEEPDTILQVESISCGRVTYTNVKTKHYDSMPIKEFNTYYEEADKEEQG